MKAMKILSGIVLILGGIAFGVYVGFWLMFVGGIIDVINAVKATEIEANEVALGIAKTVFASFLCYVAAAIPCFIGYVLLEES